MKRDFPITMKIVTVQWIRMRTVESFQKALFGIAAKWTVPARDARPGGMSPNVELLALDSNKSVGVLQSFGAHVVSGR